MTRASAAPASVDLISPWGSINPVLAGRQGFRIGEAADGGVNSLPILWFARQTSQPRQLSNSTTAHTGAACSANGINERINFCRRLESK
jgi:hypothetical protein